MGFVRILKKLIPSAPTPTPSVDGESALTNKKIMKELVNHFKFKLEEESFGDQMLYPMSYTILMDAADYADRKDALGLIVKQTVAKYYEIIKDMQSEYSEYEPICNNWYFQFVPCYDTMLEGVTITRGSIRTMARLVPPDEGGANVSVETNVQVSMRLDNSNVISNVNLNPDVLKNIDSVGEGTFRVRFDKSLNTDKTKIQLSAKDEALAILSYPREGKNYRYSMVDNLIHISGKGETRKGRAFFIVDHEDVKDSHVQIRYEDGKFQIAAFGPTRLNGRKLTESSGIPQWVDLANNSTIFFDAAMFSVKFEIKQN
jgi:hypothetical protein